MYNMHLTVTVFKKWHHVYFTYGGGGGSPGLEGDLFSLFH